MTSGAPLYHALPEAMSGSVLYPLNELRERDPETFARERAKYNGREDVLTLPVPLLDCLWNDVLHLSPVAPGEIVEALESAGFTPNRRRFVEVDSGELDPAQSVLFLNTTNREHRFDESQWHWFDPRLVPQLSRLPQATRRYYADCARNATVPLLFAWVPHVLFRGSLDLSGLPVVEV